MRIISRFGRFCEEFPTKGGTVRVPLPFSRNRPENHSHNLGKAFGKGLGLLCAPFTYLSLSPLSLLSLPPSLYISFYLSFSFSPSLCLLSIILFGVSNGRFRPCYYNIVYIKRDFTIWEKMGSILCNTANVYQTPFYATQKITPFLNSINSAHHAKGRGFHPMVKYIYPLLFL